MTSTFDLDLWPMTLKTFQQRPLTWWKVVSRFTETPPLIKEISRHAKYVLTDGQTDTGRMNDLKTYCLLRGFFGEGKIKPINAK